MIRRRIELVVLNCSVTETNDTPCASKSSRAGLVYPFGERLGQTMLGGVEGDQFCACPPQQL